jgi:hypothetical protein
VEGVVKRLSRANIPFLNAKTQGKCVTFQVSDEYVKKVFAIFAHPCYNINIISKSGKSKIVWFALNRMGLLLGLAVFLTSTLLSNVFVLKVQVTGSGSYLSDRVKSIIGECGLTVGDYYKKLDVPLARSKIMALPNVTFCSIQRSGSALIVDVQAQSDYSASLNSASLICDVEGVVTKVVAICGTPLVQQGDKVQKGQKLIGAYAVAEDGSTTNSIACGFVAIECVAQLCVAVPSDSQEDRAMALKSPLLYAESVQITGCTARTTGEGVNYLIDFTYCHILSINME